MELEYKWDLRGPEVMEQMRTGLASVCRKEADVTMDAVYYDTPEGLFADRRGALRLRQENGVSVCCMKVDRDGEDGYRIREEYEVSAASVREGLEKLPDAGAPAQLCRQAAAGELLEVCRIAFQRRRLSLAVEKDGGSCEAELAFDRGEVRRHGRTAPIREVELEFKAGDVEMFHAFASELQRRFSLCIQEQSKLARALAL